MAPATKKSTNPTNNFLIKYVNVKYAKSLLVDPAKLPIVTIGILLAELVLNIFIVQRVNYTEIDWIAYMQECEGFLNGTTNYSLLKGKHNLIFLMNFLFIVSNSVIYCFSVSMFVRDVGAMCTGDTGPLVYPAGFVYIYSFFYFITNRGQNIRIAQYCFVGIYLLQMYLVLNIYAKSRKVPPYVLIISAFTSHRIHSIYVLRLFNDPVAILFLYAAINFYINGNWTIGSIFLSLGVSVKMNVLLFAPAILLLYIVNLGYWNTFKQLSICAAVQLILGAPFLLTHPLEYLRGSFDFGRIFEHKWTVNYRFLPQEIFEHKYFHVSLLLIHISMLLVFAVPTYTFYQTYCRWRTIQAQLEPQIAAKNQELREKKCKTSKKPRKPIVQDSEKLTDEELKINEKIFLNSFETMLKKANGGATVPQNITKQPVKETEEYEIFFDRVVQFAILPIFLANFIGIVCARSLHYQFYVWYFHSLPYLAWFSDYGLMTKFLILGVIEYAWNTYPSTNVSSLMLHISHIVLLIGIGRKLLRTQQDAQRLKCQ